MTEDIDKNKKDKKQKYPLEELEINDEIKYKLIQSPHTIPLLLFITMYDKFIIQKLPINIQNDDKIILHDNDRVDILLFIHSCLKYDYMEYMDFERNLNELLKDESHFMRLYHTEMTYISNDITCFTNFMKNIKNQFVQRNPPTKFPNEIDIFVYQCLISFHCSDIFGLFQMLNSLKSIIDTTSCDVLSTNVFTKYGPLKEKYKTIDLKHYIKCLIINMEKRQNIDEIKSFILLDSDLLLELFPYLKTYINYLIKLYHKYCGIDQENNTEINLRWDRNDLNVLKESISTVSTVNNDQSNEPNNIGAPSDNTNTNNNTNNNNNNNNNNNQINDNGDDNFENQFRLKFELLRNNFDQILIKLSQSNLSYHDIQFIINHFHHMLYYLLSSNRRTNIETYMLHFCFCWNSYIEIKYNNAYDNNNTNNLIPSTTSKLELIDGLDFSHLKNALTSMNAILSSLNHDNQSYTLKSYYVLDCFLKFYKIIHSFNVITIDKVDEFTLFAGLFPDMSPTCALYRAYCYQSIGLVEPTKKIIEAFIDIDNYISKYYSLKDITNNYNISIYDRKSTILSALSLLMQLSANTNHLYEMDNIVTNIEYRFDKDDVNDNDIRYVGTLRDVYQSYLRNDIIQYEINLLNISSYYHQSNETLKNFYYRYAFLKDDSITIFNQLQISYNYFHENTVSNDDKEFTFTLDKFEILLSNAIIYAKILKRIGRRFDSLKIVTDCIEKCTTMNYCKYLYVLFKMVISFLNIKGKNGSALIFNQSVDKLQPIFCEYI